MNPNVPDETFYVNEHFTSTNKALFFVTMKFTKENDYAYTWCLKIFIRKKGGLPETRIFSPEHIQRLEEKLKGEEKNEGEQPS